MRAHYRIGVFRFLALDCLPLLLLGDAVARELTISLSAAYEDAVGMTAQVDISNLVVDLVTARCHHTKQNVGFASQEAINLGDVSTLGVMILVNLDPTNYIEVKHATGGTIIAKLFPLVDSGAAGLNWCCLQVGSGISAPFVIANSGACEMEIFLLAL